MNKWVKHTYEGSIEITWLRREEQLSDGKWLICFIHPEGYDYTRNQFMGGGWIYISNTCWADSQFNPSAMIEEISFERGIGPLEIECVCHEMRAKYAK